MEMESYFTRTDSVLKRFFFIFGLTKDRFCEDNHIIVDLDRILYKHLKDMGYKRIIFYSLDEQLYFYDIDSFNSTKEPDKVLKEKIVKKPITRTNRLQGPLPGKFKPAANTSEQNNASKQIEPTSETGTGKLYFGRMDANMAFERIDYCIRDKKNTGTKTAVIFTNADDFKHFTKDIERKVDDSFNQFDKLDNQNIVLFVFQEGTQSDVFANYRGTFFERKNSEKKILETNTININSPAAEEIRNTINYYRLMHGLSVDFTCLDIVCKRIARELCKEKHSLKWLRVKLENLVESNQILDTEKCDAMLELGKHGNKKDANEKKSINEKYHSRVLPPLVEERVLNLEEITKELNEMTGLDEIKRRLEVMYKIAQVSGPPPKPSHFVFKGRPGTGKTEVARLMGQMFHSLGILPKSDVIEVSKSDLTGMYQGDTSTKPLEICKKALGGVLLVDEAYQIGEGNPNDGSSDIITTIMKFIEDNRESMCTIFTGYGPQMEEFLRKNPGMTSRVGQRNIIEFPDYKVDELLQIARKMAQGKELVFSVSFTEVLQKLFEYRLKHADENYGNARDVRQIIDEAHDNLRVRLFDISTRGETVSDEDRITLIADDLGKDYRKSIIVLNSEETTFEDIAKDLNEMVGLKNIKERLERIYKSLIIRKKQNNVPPKPSHFIFKGRPGTGKTEVARQLGKIYNALGVLPTSNVVEVSKSDLTGMYQGDTSTKPLKKCREALGGVLLVDEAYQLVEGNQSGSDSDIVTTIMKFIEDNRESMCAVFTGYGPQMDKFLSTNSGMLSRLGDQNIIEFPDYSVDELIEIAQRMTIRSGYKMGDSFIKEIRVLFTYRLKNAGNDYGNARDVRQIIDYACESLEVRVYDAQKDGISMSEDDRKTLVAEDLKDYGNNKNE